MTAMRPPLIAPRGGVDDVGGLGVADVANAGLALGLLGLREHHLGHVERPGRVHDRGGEQERQRRAQQRVADQRRARHGGEARRHHDEQLRARQPVEVGLDHQRRLGLPEEDDRRGVERLDLGRAQGPRDRATDDLDDPLDDAQVIEQADERADEDDHGQDLEREDRRLLVRHEVAEPELDPGVRCSRSAPRPGRRRSRARPCRPTTAGRAPRRRPARTARPRRSATGSASGCSRQGTRRR
jgi:hypothetical protein